MIWRLFSVIGVMSIFRLVLAAYFPMTNDEAYYWDWGRELQLSYFDHPPAVAWMTWLSQHLATGNLSARLLAPLMHALATLFLWLSLRYCEGADEKKSQFWLLALTQIPPGLSLWGSLALPDTMLLPLASATLYLCLRYAQMDLKWWHGACLGFLLGFAGCAKYHALPVCGGLALGLAIERRGISRDLGFWLSVLAAGVLATTPVWLWNLRNDFASVRFQSGHGFAGLAFHPVYFLRAIAGQLVLLTPLVFVTAFAAARRRAIAALGFFPLVLLILGVAAFKQVLPHWILPAYWVVLPFVACAVSTTRAAKFQLGLFAVITLTLPWLLAAPPLLERLLSAAQGNPGYLSELTLWPKLATEVERRELLKLSPEQEFAARPCAGEMVVVTERWFWGAQLAFHMKGQPKVRVIDANRGSYYDQRDSDRVPSGCPVLLIVDRDHFDPARLAQYLVLSAPPEHLVVPEHEALQVLYAYGSFR